MSSPISSALAKLDDCLQAVQVQVEYLRSGLEVDDAQLTAVLEDACQNAVEVRELIRAERSDANWNNRQALDGLIIDLEIEAHERRNQELRVRLLELADELEAGAVRHRSESRTSALNTLLQEAIQELRAEAAIPEQTKELPGPEASEWLHWACNLEEGKDADALQCLRTEFAALDQFAGEMEENYWTPGDRVRRSATPPTPPPAARRGPSPPAYTPPRPPAPSASSDYGRSSHNVGGRPEASQGPGYAAAVARAYERPSSAAPATVESRRPEPSGGIALVTEAPQAEPVKAPEAPARVVTPPAQRTAPRAYPVVEKPKQGGNGAATANEVRAAAAPKPQATVVVTPVERAKPPQPAAKPVEKPAEKPAEKKAKDRKQQQQQQQQQQQRAAAEAAATAAAAAKAAEVARAKAAAEAAKSAKIAKVEVEEVETETWSSKWTDLRENGGEALADGRWQRFAFAPESLAVIGLLLCIAIGLPMWMMHKKSANTSPTTVAQNSAPAAATIAPAQAANTLAPAAGTPSAPNGKTTTDAQGKPQDPNAASKTQSDQTPQRDNPAPAQVLSPAPEAPKIVAKSEEPSAAEPPPMVGAASGATGGLGIMKDMPGSVPKLAGQKLRVSSGVAQGQLTHQVTPQYPSQARQERVQGTVVLQAVIAKDGSVEKLSIVSGPSQLTKAAMEAVKQWRYRPFALNGEPVEADTQINVNFKLGE